MHALQLGTAQLVTATPGQLLQPAELCCLSVAFIAKAVVETTYQEIFSDMLLLFCADQPLTILLQALQLSQPSKTSYGGECS